MINILQNTNYVKKIKCNCSTCFHSSKKKGIKYCEFYFLTNPKKAYCSRYAPKIKQSSVDGLPKKASGKRQKPLTKDQKAELELNKKKFFPWELG